MKKLLSLLICAGLIIISAGCKQNNIPQEGNIRGKILNYNEELSKEYIGQDNKTKEEKAVKPVSEDLEIIPTLNTVSETKNQVWVGTFQLVWNDLINEFLKAPVEFVNYKSVAAENLNKQEFTASELSENSYYKKWGEALPALKAEIEKGIEDKFNEKSDILNRLQWDSTPEMPKYVLYAMLKKEFEFLEKFESLDKGEFEGSQELVKYFGVNDNSDYKLRSSVKVLFYENPQNFAVELKTKQDDKVYIYRNNENKTLDVLYKEMLNKADNYEGNKILQSKDKFKVPLINYKADREFPEFYYKEIKAKDFVIAKAIETVEFKMNETGVKLKSEAAVEMMLKSTAAPRPQQPRYFNADGPFVIFIEENGKKPYFAMKVGNAAKLQ